MRFTLSQGRTKPKSFGCLTRAYMKRRIDMATLSMFFGIIIKMYKERGGRHNRAHIHAQHAGKTASFDLETSEILAG